MFVYEQFELEQNKRLTAWRAAKIWQQESTGAKAQAGKKRGGCDTDELNNCGRNMPEAKKLGHVIREMNTAFKKKFITCGMAAGLDEVTLMHGWIMGYLHHNQNREIYQKTIESEFNIRRSTVTTILQLMEKKGYIRREAVAGDARLKRIVLTQQGTEIAVQTKSMIDNMERRLTEGIGEKELAVFFETAEKLLQNMGR